MSDTKPVMINGTIYWANFTTPNDLSGKYQFDFGNLSPAAVEALEGIGIEVKEGTEKREEMGNYITCKSNYPFEPVNTEGDKVAGNIVGNGSTATAAIRPYAWTFKNKKGISPSVVKLVIKELEVYEAGEAYDVTDADMEAAL